MKFKTVGVYFTLFFFAVSGIAYPQQTASVTDSTSKLGQPPVTRSTPVPRLRPDLSMRADLNPYNIAIPDETGKIEEVFQGSPNAPLIVHIQDAHANYEAQVNIKKIINELVKQYGFSLVQLEGAVSKLDPDALKPSYLEEANVKLADFLMREGRITGADAYAVEAGESVELYGIEDQLLYLENIRMFKQIYSHQDEVNAYFDAVHDAFDSIGRKLLAPGPLDFTRKTEEFSQDKIDLLDYLLYLNGVAEKANRTPLSDLKEMVHYPNLVRIMRLHAIEKQMDRNALKKEGMALKEEFTKRNLLSAEVDALLSRFEDPQKGAKPRDYFLKLTEAADQGQIEFLSYPQLRMFAEYLIYQDEIDHKAVFSELLRYKSYLEGELFKGENEKKLLQLIDFAGLLEQYFRLEMSREKIARFLEHRGEIKPSVIAAGLERLGKIDQVPVKPFGNLEQLDSYMNDLEYFYQLVLKRDEVFIEKIISRMKTLNQDKTILVTGGFHKDGMTDHFRKQNLSYVVISPKVGVEQGNENYVKVMLDQDVVVGGAFTGSFALTSASFDTQTRDFLDNQYTIFASEVAATYTYFATPETQRPEFEPLIVASFAKQREATGNQFVIEPVSSRVVNQTAIGEFIFAFYFLNEVTKKHRLRQFRSEARYNNNDGSFIVTTQEVRAEARLERQVVRPPSELLGLVNRLENVPSLDFIALSEQIVTTPQAINFGTEIDNSLVVGHLFPTTDLPIVPVGGFLGRYVGTNITRQLESAGTVEKAARVAEGVVVGQESNQDAEVTAEQIAQTVADKRAAKYLIAERGIKPQQDSLILAIVSEAENIEERTVELFELAQKVQEGADIVAVYYAPEGTEELKQNITGISEDTWKRIEIIEAANPQEAVSSLSEDISGGSIYNWHLNKGGQLKSKEAGQRFHVRVLTPIPLTLEDTKILQIESQIGKARQEQDQVLLQGVRQLQLLTLVAAPVSETIEQLAAELLRKYVDIPFFEINSANRSLSISKDFWGLIRNIELARAEIREISKAA